MDVPELQAFSLTLPPTSLIEGLKDLGCVTSCQLRSDVISLVHRIHWNNQTNGVFVEAALGLLHMVIETFVFFHAKVTAVRTAVVVVTYEFPSDANNQLSLSF